jgi:cell division septation protein DedD
MIKPLIILFNTVSVFLFSFFFGDTPVTISGNFPKSANVATEFTAEIKINKGSIGGFAKLQLEVPQGFTVKELDSKTGNFSFATNIAKIIWTSMPSDQEFTVKFAISADASAAGAKTIASKFSYVNNNNKEVVEMTPAEIMIGDGSTAPVAATSTPPAETTSSTTPPVTETTPAATSSTQSFDNPTEPNSNIVAARNITPGVNANEYNVEVKIKKGGIKGFAKYQEMLPAGYNAKGDKLNGSSFSVSDGKLKFVWVSLPTDDELVVSYVLEKTASASADAKLDNGEFSYLENDQSKKVKMPIDVFGNSTPSAVAKVTEPTPTPTPTVAAEPVTTVATSEPVKTEPTTTTEPVKTEPVATATEPKTTVAKKEGSVVYNVQIGAFNNAIQSEVLAKKFNISENIKSEMAQGFNKFMVGNFNEYKEARSHRENIKQKGCSSAFVVAYNGAKRITVQEALMITSQKWFK